MPFSIQKTDHAFRVVNKETGHVHAKHTTLPKAEAQVRLMSVRDAEERVPTAIVHHPYHPHAPHHSVHRHHPHDWAHSH